jgi:hypothetical protein
MLVGFIFFATVNVTAAERTGEILRDLLKAVEQDFETLEKDTSGFARRSDELMSQIEEKAKAFARTQDAVAKQVIRAEVYHLQAQANDQDRREVQATLRAIGDVRGKLDKIRGVLEGGGLLPNRNELPRFRRNMGRWLGSTANLLDALERRAGAEGRHDINQLKATLIGVVNAWESPATAGGSSEHELLRTVRTLDTTYAQLISLERVLEMEKHALQARNYEAYLQLLLTRLTNGKANVESISDAIAGKRQGVGRRGEVLRGLDGSLAPGASPAAGAGLSGEAAAAWERTKQGRIEWAR